MADSSSYPATSRYYGLPTSQLQQPDGTVVTYLQRRLLPPSSRFATLQEHTVSQGDRLDNVTAQYLSDPEQFWRICDANDAMAPDDLTATVGRVIRITLPEGVPGPQSA